MDARTRALVLAILIGSVLIAAAIYFRPQSDLTKIDPNPCDGPGKQPAEGLAHALPWRAGVALWLCVASGSAEPRAPSDAVTETKRS